MTTIKKRADELKPGDVVTLGVKGRCSFLYWKKIAHEDNVRLEFGMHDGRGVITYVITPDDKLFFDVDVNPDLTPAQLHAEELADALRTVLDCEDAGAFLYRRHMIDFRALLDKINPPEPPTLAETIESLRRIGALLDPSTNTHPDVMNALAILDRARRFGLI